MAGVSLAAAFSLALHSLQGLLSMPVKGELETFLVFVFPSPILQLFRQTHLCLASPLSDIFQDMFSKG